MATEIKVNSAGMSKLVLTYPIALRVRAARAAKRTGISEQELIRRGIERYTKWVEGNVKAKRAARAAAKAGAAA